MSRGGAGRRTLPLVAALAAAAVGCARQEEPGADLRAEVLALLDAQVRAWNRGDLESFMHGYANDPRLTFVGSKGVTHGYATLLEHYRKGYPDRRALGELRFFDLDVWTLDGDHAVATGRYELIREKDRPAGIFSLTLARRGGTLLIHMDHTSETTAPATETRRIGTERAESRGRGPESG
jgi:hypothetical protein